MLPLEMVGRLSEHVTEVGVTVGGIKVMNMIQLMQLGEMDGFMNS